MLHFVRFIPYGQNLCFRLAIPLRQLDMSLGASGREVEELGPVAARKTVKY
jgi:hypothetical protein